MMTNNIYKFEQTEDNRWGIYIQDRLLATFGSYEVCQFMGQYLKNNLSTKDYQKSALAYQQVLSNQSRRINYDKLMTSEQ